MIFVLLIGIALLAIGVRMSLMVLLFYLGHRRDLYFHVGRPWVGMARLGGTLIMIGGSLCSLVALDGAVNDLWLLGGCLLVVILWWGLSPLGLAWVVPNWVHQFEDQRSKLDLETIIQNGAAMMHLYPDTFPKVIRDEGGWDVWVTTVTGAIPLVSLEVYFQRVQIGMERELYPLAIVAAENIIKYRPDDPVGYELRAKAYFRNHQYEKALADLSMCVDFVPHNPDFYFQRARLYFILSRLEDALRDLDQAIALQPDQINWHHMRTVVQQQMQRKHYGTLG